MKKSLVAALTGALVVGATATTFAAANPFSDVPAGHWAYNSVTKLTSEGVIEGYGDGTYRGNRNITRYEMAQMVARALAKAPSTNMSAASRAELEKLAAEFREELDSLGVRVEELEKHADKVKWAGKIEYTYNHHKYSGRRDMTGYKDKAMGHGGVFRLEPVAEVNDHWNAVARFDASYDGRNDETGDAKLKRVYAEGNYSKFNIKLGRFGFCPGVEDGLVVDTVASGIDLTFGSKWKVNLTAGRIGANSDEAHYGPFGPGKHDAADALGTTNNLVDLLNEAVADENNPTDVVRLGIQYDDPGDKGLYGGISYVWAKDKDFGGVLYSDGLYEYRYGGISKDGGDKASVYALNLGYRFNEKFKLWGSVARNSKANSDVQKGSWQIEARYGTYGDYAEKGAWAVWAGYSKFSRGTAVATTQGDDIATGEKGWHIGAAYAPFKNVGVLVRYADAKIIDTNIKDKHFWARCEFFF